MATADIIQIEARVRREEVLAMREYGYTFPQIAKKLGVSKGRAHWLYRAALSDRVKAEEHADCIRGLSIRAFNILRNTGLSEDATRQDVLQVLDKLRIGATFVGRHGALRNFGLKTLNEIERWLGVPITERVITSVIVKRSHLEEILADLRQAYLKLKRTDADVFIAPQIRKLEAILRKL